MSRHLTIGHVARDTGCKVQTIRYYEEIGLLPAPARSAGNQRLYEPVHIERLRFIRHSRELGFSLEAIRELLSLSDKPEHSCEAVDMIACSQLDAVNDRISRLQALKAELERMIVECRGGRVSDCRIIKVLGDHSLCIVDRHDTDSVPRPGLNGVGNN